jgi:hypothetical protein
MNKDRLVFSRRKLVTGLASTGGLLLAGCSAKELPPTYGNLLRMGDLLTRASSSSSGSSSLTSSTISARSARCRTDGRGTSGSEKRPVVHNRLYQ